MKELLENRMVSYKNKSMDVFVYIGNFWQKRPDNAHKDIKDASTARITVADLVWQRGDTENVIELKFRERAKGEYSDALINGQAELSKGSRRTKERKIGEVILAVKKWRELYTTGQLNDQGQYQEVSLDNAAKQVKISKKSLDDYFLQLKNGQKNGFNFNEHKNDKIGILRAYNKKNKKTDGASAATQKKTKKSA